MGKAKNILFLMCDQLRWDYLSCYGHPHLHTPNLDRLAAMGVRFDRAYAPSPVCGPSRMSIYTGRHVQSHGASWNFVPLKAGEMTLGDHLRPMGMRTVLVGKTHMRADAAGMARLGIDPHGLIGRRIAECGFDLWERDDGLHPWSGHDPDPAYDGWLRARGFPGENPWEEWANSAEDPDGTRRSGWFLKYSNRPARVPDAQSETPYLTGRAIDWLEQAGDQPWCLHVSYIKPHWPYIAPDPYASMYGPEHVIPPVRSEAEREGANSVHAAFMGHRVSRTFSRPGVREAVIPGYMALVKQIDDQMGRLFRYLEETGRMQDTMIVFTSDHGDYLGDHWLGEKDFFHDPSVRVPLIVFDPSPEADGTRGTVCADPVSLIDLAPTFLDVAGGAPVPHVMDGRSLMPLLRGGSLPPRPVVSEYDWALQDARITLGTPPREAWARMIFDGRWKYIHFEGHPPMLFDLETDPGELTDLGRDPGHADQRARMHEALFAWARTPRQRATVADGLLETTFVQERIGEAGVLIGYWDEAELARAVREEWHPRLATANPMVRRTLSRLLGDMGDDA